MGYSATLGVDPPSAVGRGELHLEVPEGLNFESGCGSRQGLMAVGFVRYSERNYVRAKRHMVALVVSVYRRIHLGWAAASPLGFGN